jgi:hypothetical protein
MRRALPVHGLLLESISSRAVAGRKIWEGAPRGSDPSRAMGLPAIRERNNAGVTPFSIPDKPEQEVRMPAFPLVAGCVPILRRIAGAGDLLENPVDPDVIIGRVDPRL